MPAPEKTTLRLFAPRFRTNNTIRFNLKPDLSLEEPDPLLYGKVCTSLEEFQAILAQSDLDRMKNAVILPAGVTKEILAQGNTVYLTEPPTPENEAKNHHILLLPPQGGEVVLPDVRFSYGPIASTSESINSPYEFTIFMNFQDSISQLFYNLVDPTTQPNNSLTIPRTHYYPSQPQHEISFSGTRIFTLRIDRQPPFATFFLSTQHFPAMSVGINPPALHQLLSRPIAG